MPRPGTAPEQKRIVRYVVRLYEEEQQNLWRRLKFVVLRFTSSYGANLLTACFPEPRIARVDLRLCLELKKTGVKIITGISPDLSPSVGGYKPTGYYQVFPNKKSLWTYDQRLLT